MSDREVTLGITIDSSGIDRYFEAAAGIARLLADQADDGTGGRLEVDPLAPATIRANIALEARYRRSLEASRARRPLERRRRRAALAWAAAGGATIAGSIIAGLELAPH